MTEKQELEILKEIENNSILFKNVIMYSDIDGYVYFDCKDLTRFFAKRFKYEYMNDKKQFKESDVSKILNNIITVDFR